MAGHTKKYHISMRIMHWVMAALIIGMIGLGWYMSDLPKEDPSKSLLVGLHKSFGTLLLILFFIRVFLRFTKKIPPLPTSIPPLERKLAHLGHIALYLFIGIVPLSGYAMSNFYGYGVKMFGIPMPKIFPADKELGGLAREAHELLPYVLLVIIIIHVAAVIRHRYFDKPNNDVLPRMV